MTKILTFANILLSWFVYWLSFLVPRRKHTWVFIGWYKNSERETFADNSKYVFLETAQNRPEVRAIWIGGEEKICSLLRERGYESYSVYSLKGIYYSLRAKYTIIDANMRIQNWRLSGGSKVNQLWHADGIKSLYLHSTWKLKDAAKIFLSPGLYKKFWFFIASSPFIAKHFVVPSFGCKKEEIKITGLPRYDVFFKDIKDADLDAHQSLKNNIDTVRASGSEKLIFFAPTFRRGISPKDQLAHVPLEKLNAYLEERNYHLFLSLHPKFAASNWKPDTSHSRILYSNAEYDIYPFLKEFDLLITDYSSTCLEFLLLNKPVLFFVHDLESYKKDPGIPEEFWYSVPGPRIKTFDALLQHIDKAAVEEEVYRVAQEKLFTFKKGNSSKAVVETILKDIGE